MKMISVKVSPNWEGHTLRGGRMRCLPRPAIISTGRSERYKQPTAVCDSDLTWRGTCWREERALLADEGARGSKKDKVGSSNSSSEGQRTRGTVKSEVLVLLRRHQRG